MNDLLNWGFQPIGTPLGSESALSMPTDIATGLEDPMEHTAEMLDSFTEQTARRYGNVSDPGGSVWDPRGHRALSSEVADYRTSDFMRPDEIPLSIADMSPELTGGDAILAPYAASNQLDPAALHEAGLGLSEVGAATLADSLSVVDPKFLDAIYMPPQVEPQVSNELGLVTGDGGLPEAFFDPNSGVLNQGMSETINNVITGQGQYQRVDENGVVDKYPEGTGPYDAPGITRPGSLLGALPGTVIRTKTGTVRRGVTRKLTPANVASSPSLAMQLMGQTTQPSLQRQIAHARLQSAASRTAFGTAAAQQSAASSSTDYMNSQEQSASASASLSNITGSASDSSGGASSGVGGSTYVGGDPMYSASSVDGAVDGAPKKSKVPWILLAVGAATAVVGAIVMTRKGKKAARRGR